jgi:hypothetical protein
LEFGGGSRHIAPRFALSTYGPADLNAPGAPSAIRIGLVGPADHLDGLRRWLERRREPILARDERTRTFPVDSVALCPVAEGPAARASREFTESRCPELADLNGSLLRAVKAF